MRRRAAIALAAACAALIGAGAAAAPAPQALDAQRERVRMLSAELSTLDARAGDAADAHARSAAGLRDLRARIARNARASRHAAVEQERAQARLEERLVAIYTGREPGPVEILLTADSLSEAVAAHDLRERVGRNDAALVAGLRTARARLARTRQALEERRAEAAAAHGEARAHLREMESLLADRRAVLGRARSALDGMVARRERAAALARARAAGEAAARRRARAAAPAAPATTPAPASAPDPDPDPAPPPRAPSGGGPLSGGPSYGVLDRIAQCESGGNPRAVSSSGQYRGKYQFDLGTWASVGGTGDPAEAPEAEQDLRAAMLYIRRGPQPWPICGYR